MNAHVKPSCTGCGRDPDENGLCEECSDRGGGPCVVCGRHLVDGRHESPDPDEEEPDPARGHESYVSLFWRLRVCYRCSDLLACVGCGSRVRRDAVDRVTATSDAHGGRVSFYLCRDCISRGQREYSCSR